MLTSAKENINVNEAIEMLLKEVNVLNGFTAQDWSCIIEIFFAF